MIWYLYLLIFSAVAFDACADAERDHKRKWQSHFLEALCVVSFLAIAIFYNGVGWKDHLVMLVGTYVVMRFFFFDLIYNFLTARPLADTGNSCFYDWLVVKIFKKSQPRMLLWARFVIWVAWSGSMLFSY